MIYKSFFLATVALICTATLFSQAKKDTIYFDDDWSICEKPVATYYRVCELNTDSVFYYKGVVKDYFMDGTPEMTGDYAEGGNKNGEFIFYNKKGYIIKKGNYLDNVMMGNWYFYDSLGRIKSQFFCKTQNDFTPIFLIDKHNDTIVKNGNGSFEIDNVDGYPFINSKFGFLVKGRVKNSVKDGEYKYYTYPKKELLYSEKYEDGRFVKSKVEMYSRLIGWTKDKLPVYSLSDANLMKTEMFYHSNLVFGAGDLGKEKVEDYLRYHIQPHIPAQGNYYERDKICFNIILKILIDGFMKNKLDVFNTDSEDGNKSETLSTSKLNWKQINSMRKLRGDIRLTVDTSGAVTDCVFNTNLTKEEINKMNYYLRHVTNLPVVKDSSNKIQRIMNLELKTIIDTQKNNTYVVNYKISNTNPLIPAEVLSDTIKTEKDVQVEAQFPGGKKAWLKYLEKNLHASLPAVYGAPKGVYTVVLSFIVEEDGKISNIVIIDNPGYGTALEAARVIMKSPKWIPAIKDGRNVKYREVQSISFEVSR